MASQLIGQMPEDEDDNHRRTGGVPDFGVMVPDSAIGPSTVTPPAPITASNTAMVPTALPTDNLLPDGTTVESHLPAEPTPAPSNDNVPPVLPPGPPTMVKTGSTSTSTTTRQVPTAGEAVAEGQRQNAVEAEKGALTREGQVKAQLAQTDADSAAAEQAAYEQRQKDQADLQDRREAEYNRLHADEQKAYEEWKKKSTEEVLPQSLGNRILGAIAMGLGAYASSMTGSRNYALDIINTATEQAYRAQKDKIAAARQIYDDKHGASKESDAHFDKLEAQLATRFQAGLDALKAKGVALKLKQGVPLAQIEQDKTIAALDQKSAEFSLEREKSLRKTVTNTTVTTHTVQEGGPNAGQVGGIPRGAAVFRDENGKPLGWVPSAKQLHQLETRDANYTKAEKAVKDLENDIREYGYELSPAGRARRDALYHGATLAVAAVTTAPSSDKSTQHEEGTLGEKNPFWGGTQKVTLEALQRKQEEIRNQRDLYRRQEVQPFAGQESIGGSRPAAQPSQGGPANDNADVRAQAVRAIQDPKAPPEVKAKARAYILSLGKRGANG